MKTNFKEIESVALQKEMENERITAVLASKNVFNKEENEKNE